MKTVIYARVSTSTGNQDTERQFTELVKLANYDGYTDVKIFKDNLSGDADKVAYTDRGDFSKMLQYIQENDIKQVYCWELSRLGRNMIENDKIIKDFRRNQINIFTKKEGINTKNNDANTQLQLNILSAIAEYELSTIKTRTLSGMYHNVAKGGVGSGAVKQYGYKKEAGKLVIDKVEKAVILDIVDKYLNHDYSILQITNYLNESGVETRYRKLINSEIITYKLASNLTWQTSGVARLLHKKILTGFRVYGTLEIQDESLRILDNATFEAVQAKMASMRDREPNAQKFENIFKGIMICGNCGGTMVMHKGSDGKQHHYKCYNRFFQKSNCNAAMIDIDFLNNVVYDMTKGYTVDSKDVAAKIEKLENQMNLNNVSISQIQTELKNINTKNERLLDLYLNVQIAKDSFDKRSAGMKAETTELTEKVIKLQAANLKLQNEVAELSTKKELNLSSPAVFKSNIKSLVREITVKKLDDYDISELDRMATHYAGKDEKFITRKHSRDYIYSVKIKMFDDITGYVDVVSNITTPRGDKITVGLI